MSDDLRMILVADEYCPRCDGVGDPKVTDDQGRCWWKCLTQDCTVSYWLPETGEIEDRLPPEEQAAMNARIKAEVDEMFAERGPMVRLDDGSRPGIESWGWR